MQTKKQSFIEACAGTAIGYVIAVATQMVVFPLFGVHIPMHQHCLMAILFTVISIVRGYYVRRFFNYIWDTYKGKPNEQTTSGPRDGPHQILHHQVRLR